MAVWRRVVCTDIVELEKKKVNCNVLESNVICLR